MTKLTDIQLIEDMFSGTMVTVGDNSNLKPLIERCNKYMRIIAFEHSFTVIADLDLMVSKQYRSRFSCHSQFKGFV